MSADRFSVRIRFRAARVTLARVRAVVESVLVAEGEGRFSAEDRKDILVGIQECLSNVTRHACPNGDPIVDLRVWLDGGRFFARLRDRGRPFDPADVPPPDPERPREHGYGLILLRRTMDHVSWERRGQTNVVHLERGPRACRAERGNGTSGWDQVERTIAPIRNDEAGSGRARSDDEVIG